MLTETQIDQIEKQLNNLKTRIQSIPFHKSTDLSFEQIAGEVHDSGDESVANETVEMNAAMADRKNHELEDIDNAFDRIANNTYGLCIDCKTIIDYDRLLAFPTAKRCVHCKSQFERID